MGLRGMDELKKMTKIKSRLQAVDYDVNTMST